MEGWVAMDEGDLETIISDLAHRFLEIAFIIDDLLEERSRPTRSI